ncbi:MAG TPA: YfhO family protein, partial [Candidatus Binatia bacterium]|nr:YfhO family protein [Candidatus Binatia bacterium]
TSALPWQRLRRAGVWAVVVVALCARWLDARSIIMMPEHNDAAFFAPPPAVEFLRRQSGLDRTLVMKDWQARFPFTEKIGTLHRFPVVQEYEQLTPADYHRFLAPFDDVVVGRFTGRFLPQPTHRGWPRLDLLGVRWVVVPAGRPWHTAGGRFRLAYTGPDARVFENVRSLPRAFLVDRWRVAADPAAALAALDEADFDPATTVVVDQAPAWESDAEEAAVQSAVRVAGYAEEEAVLDVTTPRRALLVLTDLYWPGWSVDVDGAPRRLHRADALFRAVAVEAGTHRVRFRYVPTSARLGLAVTTIVTTILAVALVATLGRSRRAT